MKIEITGASAFVRRMFEACGKYQWAREFLKNSLESGANQVWFGIEWQAVEKHGVYRRTIIDDGCGMSRKDLVKFMSTLGEGAKKIGGIHDNFGVGAKISSLPWNEDGVVVITYKGGQASMIWIYLDRDTGDYSLMEWEDDQGSKQSVIDPAEWTWDDDKIDWSALRPEWVTDHGTIIVLLGSKEHPDTVLGNVDGGEALVGGLTRYLNERFWDLSAKKVVVAELKSDKKTNWPESENDKEDKRRPNNRTIRGAKFYLDGVPAKDGKLEASGTVLLDDDRVKAHWYLWSGKRPDVHSHARELGYIAYKYGDELFEHTSHKAHFRGFAVMEKAVQDNLTIVLEPALYKPTNGRWGVHPDQSRNRLNFTGGGEKGVALPTADWGVEFSNSLPAPILAAILAARGDASGTIEDEEYRKRLQDRFGSRWRRKVIVPLPKGYKGLKVDATDSIARADVRDGESEGNHGSSAARANRTLRRRVVGTPHRVMTPGGDGKGREQNVPVDLPHWRKAKGEDFQKPWHLAAYSPHTPGGPAVLINVESKILQDIVTDHQKNYADHLGDEVAKIVIAVFGEVAVAKVAHAQALTFEMSEQEVDANYRTEEALTLALMGLIAEESLISQRLGKLGRKTKAAGE